MEKKYDLVVIGGGPAGLTSAIYASRSNLSVLVIEKKDIGSLQMAHQIDNYPGFPNGITGKELKTQMRDQAKRFGTEFLDATFLGIDIYDDPKVVKTDKINIKTKAIVVATGWSKNSEKKLKGESEFLGKGVSYCATCDGAFTRNKIVSLFGQGEEIAEEALFLTKYSEKIYIFVNGEKLNCNEELFKTLNENEKVEIILNSQVIQLKGNGVLETAEVNVNGEKKEYSIQYAFLYLGTKNSNELLGEFATLDEDGLIITDNTMKTNVEGIYAAGDVVSKKARQVTTAVGDGTVAGMEAIKYLLTRNK
ncbi:NAD(P)/FAD-dependent oxidoreductase [Fusobacterium sp. IOR10]|uniref:NAD(P)/FAD-dependent oxidoreductase n=1 Tax=Fusobacterium sp. IOR10 TaxID=2665157 RepID=UPI00193FE89C|nr:NAD(P)/FAD-dependent oxidoreductase [Fusobacterium sp. IOR10]